MLNIGLRGRQINFVQHHQTGLVRQFGFKEGQLSLHRMKIGQRVLRVDSGGIDQMEQNTGAFDVAQEAMTEPGALVGPFDQAGDVGHDKRFAPASFHHPQTGIKGRERIVADFGAG